ncbi:choice-of-anchor L domain-containing protein [Winogradskyella sp.]|uniref:choice-of-anchor L domain-containing protein n=1 Tax=Winogradskyella sp. TaxID=1883156 RepID=UPI0025D00E24|nr:choice-of-anchor L domain-containing protein [Winogradskyella sp.]
MNKFYPDCIFKPIVFAIVLLLSTMSFAQDITMQNGTFTRCAPDRFFDSGGSTGNYGSNENFQITLCPINFGEIVILDFTRFSTQAGSDIMTIYDGDSTASPVIGNFSGSVSPGRVVSTHPSGCLTVTFSSNGFGNTLGWQANILCATACQTITASIDSTTPAVNMVSNQIEILAGETVNFNGSAVFSDTDANASYLWNFGTGGTDTALITSHQFDTSGTFNVTFTASDDNPLGCSDTQTVTVVVAPPFVTINNGAFSESFFTPSELIENVLVTGGCSAVDNFESQVFEGPLGPAEITRKSYGYFTRGGTNFPFEEGIVITNGVAFDGGNAPVTNTVQADNGFGEDLDLEAAVGITDSRDATFIKFDFRPTTDIISFRYLMASEEYNMTDECNFADSFAFILTAPDGTVRNLAVLPDGTTINVTNINENPVCTSNPTFFDDYNIGETNYGGRTEVLTAVADNLIIDATYEIKLVVADAGLDSIFDTAIFIEAGSFNLGGDLGDDLTLAAGTASCGGEEVTLDTQAPNATHTWFLNGSPITGAGTDSTLTIDTAGTYSVNVEFAPGCSTDDEIIVEFRNSPQLINPAINLAGCSPTGMSVFNLSENTPIVFGSQDTSEFAITYHNSQADADTGDNPIPNLTNYNASDGEIIYIRIDDRATGNCVVTDSFVLNVFTAVTAEDIIYQICDDASDGDATNGIVEFDLPAIDVQILGIQDPTQFTVSYHISLTDADMGLNPLPNLYTNTTANMQDIFARVQNNSNIDCYDTSTVTLQVDEIAIANTVPPQFICDDDNDGFWDFDLVALESFVLGTQSTTQYDVTFYDSQVNADAANNALPSPYTNQVAFQQETIFARIENTVNANCFDTTDFIIDVFNQPTATTFTYELCDDAADGDDTNGFVEFNLSSIDTEILNGQDPLQFSVTYYFDQANADASTSPLSNLYTNAVANNDQIIARVSNNDNTDCYETVQVDLVVNALPVITASVDLRQCDDDTDGISNFNLTEANDLISTNATAETFSYYTSLADAESSTNPITNELAYPNTDASAAPDVLFVRVENIDTCFRVAQLQLFVATTQIPPGFMIMPYEECDDTRVDDNITDGISIFDFSDATAQIVAVFPVGQNITVTYYETTADALAETNAIPDIANHINTASPFNQTITFRVDNNTDNSCQGIGEFELATINPTPRNDTESVDITVCDDITIGDLSEEFDLTQNEAFIFDGIANLSASYFLDFDDALNNVVANQIATPAAYNNISSNETIYVRVLDNLTNCFAIVDFDITVNPLPVVVPVITIEECENNTDNVFDFDIGIKRDEILNGQDPTQFIVTFHETQQDADDLANPLPDIFTNTVNPQEIFYAITDNTTTCSNSTGSFFVEVLEGAQANPDGEPLDFELCDDNIENDGVAQFDLNSLEDEILDGQDPTDYTISYHFTEDDALNDVQPLPFLYENLSNPQTIYVRVSNNLSPDICFEVQPVPLRVNPIPDFDLDDLYILCTTTNGSEVVPVPPVLDTQLSTTDYSFEWSLDGAVLPTETGSSLTPTVGGTYSVVVTDITTSTLTRCTNVDEAIVLESEVPIVVAEVTSQAFAGNHTVEATTTNTGDFEYSLDLGPWQDNGSFENVRPGVRTVYARDINGCGIGSVTILVIDYPLYFTPNGDGNHDTWNIVGIGTQPSAKIYIFDRYGKLLKQLSPTSSGWDGTYQGNLMPTDDYWFTIEYIEPLTGETKQQTAHFTLKR